MSPTGDASGGSYPLDGLGHGQASVGYGNGATIIQKFLECFGRGSYQPGLAEQSSQVRSAEHMASGKAGLLVLFVNMETQLRESFQHLQESLAAAAAQLGQRLIQLRIVGIDEIGEQMQTTAPVTTGDFHGRNDLGWLSAR
jgi:hypothetical protein